MGIFTGKQKLNEPAEQYGIENQASFAEVFGTTGIEEPDSIKKEKSDEDLFFETLDYCTSIENNDLINIQRGLLTKEGFFKKITGFLKTKTEDELLIHKTIERLEKFIWGYYILEDYINDDSISDIKVLDEKHIRLKRYGKRINADVQFKDEQDLKRFVDIICSRNKVTLSDVNAILKFTDAHSNEKARLRFNLTGESINSSQKPVIHIRKVLKKKKTLKDLTVWTKDEKGNDVEPMLPEELMEYVIDKAKNSSGIVFTGKGASGKTTLMNSLLDYIPEDKSGLVIQESDELFSDHPDMMFQHVIQRNGEGKISYSLKDLATNGLLTDLDYFIIGEIKGEEAAYFMNAAYTGHQCWTSVHGVNSQEAMNKLTDYVKYATNYPREDVLNMLKFMNCVIFMKDFHVEEISEVTGFDQKTKDLTYKLVYTREKGFVNHENH